MAFRVLSLDGGGMRGLYTATYLQCLANAFEKKRGVATLDIGAAFNLIVGTSTGAIIACALAVGLPLSRVAELYRSKGQAIFPRRLPTDHGVLKIYRDLKKRPSALKNGTQALRAALEECLGSITIGEVYSTRKIALAIPAIELGHHNSFVFKTAHLPNSMHRDDDYKLVEVCLASSAAPIYRSLAAIDTPNHPDAFRVFADGGLWANNPVLVGLIDALELTKATDRIEIFCLGTCPRPAGELISKDQVHRGLREWKFGGEVATLGIDTQEFAYDHMARMLARHVQRSCAIVRFPREQVPAQLMQYLDLDDTSTEARNALTAQAHKDAEMANSRCGDDKDAEGVLVRNLFMEVPALKEARTV